MTVITVHAGHLAGWIVERSSGAQRYLFGIAGPPGSGKSTLAAALAGELAAPIVPMDGFHLPNAVLAGLGLRDVKGAPETFDADAFVELMRRLRTATHVVECPAFDRTIDEPVADQVRVEPDDVVVIVEGNYLLLDEPPWSVLVDLFDAIGYLDVPDEVRIQRLVDRHVEFGRSRSEAVAFVNRSDEANARRIAPTKGRADVLVSFVHRVPSP
jgi:pantothenate kinase